MNSAASRRFSRRLFSFGAVTSIAMGAHLAHAEPLLMSDADPAHAVVVIVKVPTPWYAPRFMVTSKMRATIPTYQSIDGLSYKAFSIEQQSGKFGGIYYWRDRQTAAAWYSPDWEQRVTQERGAAPEVMVIDAPVALDNSPEGETSAADFDGVATLVTIPVPAHVTREQLVQGFKAAVPTYQKVEGLMRKYFIITGDGRFGGIYLWRDQASADAWFTQAWVEKAQTAYGNTPSLTWFDTPVLTPTILQRNRLAVARP